MKQRRNTEITLSYSMRHRVLSLSFNKVVTTVAASYGTALVERERFAIPTCGELSPGEARGIYSLFSSPHMAILPVGYSTPSSRFRRHARRLPCAASQPVQTIARLSEVSQRHVTASVPVSRHARRFSRAASKSVQTIARLSEVSQRYVTASVPVSRQARRFPRAASQSVLVATHLPDVSQQHFVTLFDFLIDFIHNLVSLFTVENPFTNSFYGVFEVVGFGHCYANIPSYKMVSEVGWSTVTRTISLKSNLFINFKQFFVVFTQMTHHGLITIITNFSDRHFYYVSHLEIVFKMGSPIVTITIPIKNFLCILLTIYRG